MKYALGFLLVVLCLSFSENVFSFALEDDWWVNGGQINKPEGVISYNISTSATNPWDNNWGRYLSADADTEITFKFSASVTEPKTVTIMLQKSVAPFSIYDFREVALTPGNNVYSPKLSIRTADKQATLIVWLGTVSQPVSGNLVFSEISITSVPKVFSGRPLSDDWWSKGGAINRPDGTIAYNIATPAVKPWDNNWGRYLSVGAGTVVTLNFSASMTESKTITIMLQRSVEPYDIYDSEEVTLIPGKNTYAPKLSVINADERATLLVWMGTINNPLSGNLVFSNISIFDSQKTMKEAILILRLLTGQSVDYHFETEDVSGDGKLGIPEVMLNLRTVAGFK